MSSLLPSQKLHEIRFTLNGQERIGYAFPRMLLSDFLRQVIGSTGTHVGCEHGICGACTVLIDDIAQRSCLTLAVQVEGRRVQSVEGLATKGKLNELQSAFKRHHALQCGFCTSGILMSAHDWLARQNSNTPPTEAAVREMLSGHLCRCTGYQPIVAAILEVAHLQTQKRQEKSNA